MNQIRFPRIKSVTLKKGDEYFWTGHEIESALFHLAEQEKEYVPEVLIRQNGTIYQAYGRGVLAPDITIKAIPLVSEFTKI